MDSEKLFRNFDTLLSIVPDPLVMLDLEGRYTYCNRAALEILGLSNEDILGRWPRDLSSLPADTVLRLENNLEKVKANRCSIKDQNRVMTKDGPRYFEYHLSPLFGEAGEIEGFTVLNRDVTEQVEEKKNLQSSVQQLKLEQRLREQFVDTLTHDLRNPLAMTRLCSQILSKKIHDPETTRKLCEQINVNIDRADAMIQDLLDSSRIRAGEKLPLQITDCQLDRVIAETLDDLKAIHGDRFIFQGSEIHGYWSKKDIRRALENLAHNAIKYGAPEMPITVRCSLQERTVELSVHNEGPAIPVEEQAKLFGAFQRSESARQGNQKGWGLGLVLIKGIAEAHGGKVSFESIPQKGTTFQIFLPLDCRPINSPKSLPF
jgi:PAS domain S-box-containing protein